MMKFAVNLRRPHCHALSQRGSLRRAVKSSARTIGLRQERDALRRRRRSPFLAVGSMVKTAEEVRDATERLRGYSCSLINVAVCQTHRRGDAEYRWHSEHRLLVTHGRKCAQTAVLESMCSEYYNDREAVSQTECPEHVPLPDDYVEHGNVELAEAGSWALMRRSR